MIGTLWDSVKPRSYWLVTLYWHVVFAAAFLLAVAAGGLWYSQAAEGLLIGASAAAAATCFALRRSESLRVAVARPGGAARLRSWLLPPGLMAGFSCALLVGFQIALMLADPKQVPRGRGAPLFFPVAAGALGLGLLLGVGFGFIGRPAAARRGDVTGQIAAFLRTAWQRLRADAPESRARWSSSGELEVTLDQPPLEGIPLSYPLILWMMITSSFEAQDLDYAAGLGLFVFRLIGAAGLLAYTASEFVRWLRGAGREGPLMIAGDRIRCKQERSGTPMEVRLDELVALDWQTEDDVVFLLRSGRRYRLGLERLGYDERRVVREWLAERLPFYRPPLAPGRTASSERSASA